MLCFSLSFCHIFYLIVSSLERIRIFHAKFFKIQLKSSKIAQFNPNQVQPTNLKNNYFLFLFEVLRTRKQCCNLMMKTVC
jgi:hypothetical protein